MAGLDLGLEEVRLAICRLGRGLDGCLASAGVLEEDGGGVLIPLYVQGFHGFRDGGGPIHSMDMDFHMPVMVLDMGTDCRMLPMVGTTDILGARMERLLMHILPQLIRSGILQRHTWHIGKGAN